MTIIIGLVDEYKQIHFACDSCATDMEGEQIESYKNQKIFQNDEYILGVSGSFRIMDILKFSFGTMSYSNYFFEQTENIKENITEEFCTLKKMQFMVQVFIPDLIKCLKKNKALTNKEGVVSMDGNILVGFDGTIFCIDSDFQVGCGSHDFMVIGSASEPARGSLLNSYYSHQDPHDSLCFALLASKKYTKNIKGPFLKMCNTTFKIKNIDI